MKKRIICPLLAMMLSTTAFAAEIETSVNFDTRDVSVSGTIEQAAFNRMISVIISDETQQYYVNTVGTEADGSYRFTFRMPETAETGQYNIAVDALGREEAAELEFYFAKKQDLDDMLALLNGAANADEILKGMEANINIMNIPVAWYKSLDNAGKTAIAEALYRAKPYTAMSEATAVANNELAVQAFRCADQENEIEAVLQDFAAVFNINQDTAACYGLYNSGTFKQEARKIMAGYDCKDIAGVIKAYNEATLLAAINNAADPKNIQTLMADYSSVIPFALTVYNQSDKEKTAAYLYECNAFDSMSALETAIRSAYDKQNAPSRPNTGGNGGNGGSNIINIPPVITGNPDNGGSANPTEQDTFSDLGGVEWAKEAITYLVDKNIVSGMGNNKFEPNMTITREQFVLMVVNAFGISNPSASCAFADMPQTHWAHDAVAAACSEGIIFGVSDDLFGTGSQITRQDMAVIAYRAAQKAGYKFEAADTLDFADTAEIADYAKESVAAMSKQGIINGYPDARFAPADTATRAQAAQVLYAIIK